MFNMIWNKREWDEIEPFLMAEWLEKNYYKGQEGQRIIGSQSDPKNSQCVRADVCLEMYMKNWSSFTYKTECFFSLWNTKKW